MMRCLGAFLLGCVFALAGCASHKRVPIPRDDVILKNAHLTVTLSAADCLLPQSVKTRDDRELLAGGKCFRTILTWLDRNDQHHWDDEDNAGGPSHTLVSLASPTGRFDPAHPLRAKLKTDHFVITRTFELYKDAPGFRMTYYFRCVKDVLLSSIDNQFLPYVRLAADFDQGVLISDAHGKREVRSLVLDTGGMPITCVPPEPVPAFAVSGARGDGCVLLPGPIRGGNLFTAFGSNRIIKGQSFGFSFAFVYVPRASSDALLDLYVPYENHRATARALALAKTTYMTRRRQPKNALIFAREAMRLDRASGYVANVVAHCYQALRDPVNTAEYWIKATELERKNSHYMEWAATAIRHAVKKGIMPKGRMEQALALNLRAVKIRPNNAFHHRSLAETCEYLGLKVSALEHYERALYLMKNVIINEQYKRREIPRFERKIRDLKRARGKMRNDE